MNCKLTRHAQKLINCCTLPLRGGRLQLVLEPSPNSHMVAPRAIPRYLASAGKLNPCEGATTALWGCWSAKAWGNNPYRKFGVEPRRQSRVKLWQVTGNSCIWYHAWSSWPRLATRTTWFWTRECGRCSASLPHFKLSHAQVTISPCSWKIN